MRSVGWPDDTGTPWPSLPHVPAQVSKSLPTASTAEQRLGSVADELRGADRLGDLAVLDHVRLGDAEDEVAGRGVHLAAAERDAVEAVRRLADDVVRVLGRRA